MKDSDIDTLSADGAQNGPNSRTDPRAALAADLGHDLWYLQDKANKRGVLLVTEKEQRQAHLAGALNALREIDEAPKSDRLALLAQRHQEIAAEYAALSAESGGETNKR